MKIKYELYNQSYEYITPCPNKKIPFKGAAIIMVGTGSCCNCEFFIDKDRAKKVVICSYINNLIDQGLFEI
jgi:hypothetical protein